MKKIKKRNKHNTDNLLKKTWNFLWKEDSFLSWIVFLILIFIFIKFIFFPSLSFLTGTTLPIVIVESCSMYHDTNFDDWWKDNGEWYEDEGINKERFEDFPLRNGFTKGDIFFVIGTSKDKVKLGETIIFASKSSQRPIIHRVVNLQPLQTKGDNNDGQFISSNNPEGINEKNIQDEQIIGKATSLRIPFLGWLKLIFFEPLRAERDQGFCKG